MEFFGSDRRVPDYDYEGDYDDPYGQPEIPDYGDYDGFFRSQFSPFTLSDILEHCIEPTLRDGFKHIGKLIFWCMVFRGLTQSSTRRPSWMVHGISAGIGVIVLAHFFYLNILYPIGLTLSSWIVLRSIHFARPASSKGVWVAFLCISFNTVCELFVANPVDWHQVRGAQMVLSMKVISLGFDMDSAKVSPPTPPPPPPEENKKLRKRRFARRNSACDPAETETSQTAAAAADLTRGPTFFEFFGYGLNPGTSVLGPWISYDEYLAIYVSPRWNLTWLVKIVFSMTFGFMFLTMSTCWITWFIPENNMKWLLAYRDAMSFRSSHYFVSFMSEASAVAAGFGCSENPDNVGQASWNVPVTEPHTIEVPRSLVEVVVSWNIPMHKWLKQYCFKKAIGYGRWVAVMATFLASTFLHGLNFQLAAVLVSLGAFTYTEARLRSRLATIFDASIQARRRGSDTAYRHREASLPVMLANTGFGLLTCVHLMYLGVMFDQRDVQAEGYAWHHTLSKWESLGFFSHLFVAASFLLSLAI